jgi:hypothetical protein
MARAYAFDENGKDRANKAIRWVEGFREKQVRRQRRFSQPFEDIKIYNDGAGEMPQYGIGGVSGVDEINGEKVIKVGKPGATFSRDFLVNSGDDLAYQKVGTSKNRPVLRVLCDAAPAIGETWGAKPSQWTLSKGYPGFTILGHIGDNIAIARQESIDHLVGKPGSTVSKGGSGSFTIWLKATGSWAASSLTITATALGAECTSGKYAKLEYIAGEWIAGPLECAT